MPTRKKTVTLEQIFEKLAAHDQRFDSHDQQFARIFEKLASHDERFDSHDKRFDNHDKRFDNHDKQFANLAKQLFRLEDLFKDEIKRLGERIDAILGNLEKFTGDFETLDQEYQAIALALKRIEQRLGDPEEGSESIRSQLDSLKKRMSEAEERILAIESK